MTDIQCVYCGKELTEKEEQKVVREGKTGEPMCGKCGDEYE